LAVKYFMNNGRTMMLSKHCLISVICLFVILQGSPSLALDAEPVGWATVAGGTTGGQGGQVVTVTNKTEFTNAVSGTTPRIVQVVGTIHGDYNIPNVGSNKTIVGIGYDARIVGFSVKVSDLDNVIVRNLTFQGAMPQDGLICRRATHVWIDHCTFFDTADGLCDFSDQCDYVTVSWCRFYYTSKVNSHRLACLVGSTDNNPTDAGKLNITFHHNWWGTYVDQRMPRGRYGHDHVFNNYYSSTGNSYCIGGSWGFKVLLENNYFDHVNNPINDAGVTNVGSDGTTYTVEIKSVGNIFNACTGNMSPYGNAFVPAYPYTLDVAANIPSIVKGGAGTTILVGDSALWPTRATVPTPANREGNAAVTSILTWRAGSTAVSHNVYFGTSPTWLVSYGNKTATSFTPPAMTADTEYYWRIDEVAADGSVITGDIWTFRTVPVLSANLYHYWPFDVDFLDVAKVFTANPNNPFGAAWINSDVELLGGGCLDLTYQKDGLIDGWSDSSTNTIFPTTAPMTISLWFKPTVLPASDKTACMLGSKPGTQTAAKTFYIELLPSGACRLTVDSATPEFVNLPALNGWNHVLISINASGQLRAWLNANDAGSITLTTTASNNYNGQYNGIGFYGDTPTGLHRGDYAGYVDDVAIWKVSSDLTLAQTLYNNGIGRTATGTSTSDTLPPTPEPMTWSAAPSAISGSEIRMTASAAYDYNGVEYYFANITDPNHDSGWQDGSTYTDTGLMKDTRYTYRVKARDKSINQNETGYSLEQTAQTLPYTCLAPIVSDFDGNCQVNIFDFAFLANVWLDNENDIYDLVQLAAEWLTCNRNPDTECWH
jgi:pectate lyase